MHQICLRQPLVPVVALVLPIALGGCPADTNRLQAQPGGFIDRPTYTRLHGIGGAVADDGTFTNPVPTSLFNDGKSLESGVYRFQNSTDHNHVIRLEVDGSSNFVREGHEFR